MALASAFVLVVLVTSLCGCSGQAKIAKVKNDFTAIVRAAERFRTTHGRWPESLEDLERARGTDVLGGEALLDAASCRDPWTGEPYLLEFTDRGLVLVSYGADRTEGGTGFDEEIRFEGALE